MPPPVVVRILDLESLVRCYAAQSVLDEPVHLWFAGPRHVPVASSEKRRIVAFLCEIGGVKPLSPLVRPALRALGEGATLAAILARLLTPASRRCFGAKRGSFQHGPVEGGSSAETVPFAGDYFLVTSHEVLVGHGSFARVLAEGDVVAFYSRLPRAPAAGEMHEAPGQASAQALTLDMSPPLSHRPPS